MGDNDPINRGFDGPAKRWTWCERIVFGFAVVGALVYIGGAVAVMVNGVFYGGN